MNYLTHLTDEELIEKVLHDKYGKNLLAVELAERLEVALLLIRNIKDYCKLSNEDIEFIDGSL